MSASASNSNRARPVSSPTHSMRSVNPSRGCQPPGCSAGSHLVARHDEPRLTRVHAGHGGHDDVETLARRDLAQEHDQRRVAQTALPTKDAPGGRRSPLVQIERVGDDADPRRLDPQRQQLRALGLADRHHGRRAGEVPLAPYAIPHALERLPTFQSRRGAVGRRHIGHPGWRHHRPATTSSACRCPWMCAMSNCASAPSRYRPQPDGREELQLVGQVIRPVPKDVDIEARGRRRGAPGRKAAVSVAHVGRADRDAMPPAHQACRQRRGQPRNTTVGPRVREVGRHV